MAHHTIVVAVVPANVASIVHYLQDIYRNRLGDPYASTLPPHVTIIEPLSVAFDPADLNRLASVPIENPTVNLYGLGTFTGRNGHVIYLQCEAPGLYRARNEILDRLPSLVTLVNASPTFHLTLARQVPEARLAEAMEFLAKHPCHERFSVGRLSVFQHNGSAAGWQHVATPVA
jgi:hypothetical protein